jgi:hypothetical protein
MDPKQQGGTATIDPQVEQKLSATWDTLSHLAMKYDGDDAKALDRVRELVDQEARGQGVTLGAFGGPQDT